MTVIVGTRDCSNCDWGDARTVQKGVGVPASNSGIGGELTIPVSIVWCLRHEEEMDPSDHCERWTDPKARSR